MASFIDTHDADYMEGLRLFYLSKYDEAIPMLTSAAERGSVQAQHFLAMMYENGNGVERDLARAAYWYEQTARHGDKEAQFTYAMICALGKGIEPDVAAACHWATLSYHQGNGKALQALQLIRSQASDVAAEATRAFKAAHESGDLEEAARQMERAAECGDTNAQFALFQLLYAGQGVEQDKEAAMLWLRDAALQGHAEAQKRLDELTGAEQPAEPSGEASEQPQ